jgi:hypothetical protein
MTIQNLQRKYLYYRKWLCEMDSEERRGLIGQWVMFNARMYQDILRQLKVKL